jgi:hypothetical protein
MEKRRGRRGRLGALEVHPVRAWRRWPGGAHDLRVVGHELARSFELRTKC